MIEIQSNQVFDDYKIRYDKTVYYLHWIGNTIKKNIYIYYTFGTIPNFNWKIIGTNVNLISLRHICMTAHSPQYCNRHLDKKKSGGITLFYGPKIPLLVKWRHHIMWVKCQPPHITDE